MLLRRRRPGLLPVLARRCHWQDLWSEVRALLLLLRLRRLLLRL